MNERLPPEERPTLGQYAAQAAGNAGGLVCPKCGCAHMAADGKRVLPSGTIQRYRYCRNPNCGAGFVVRQSPETIVREVRQHDKDSSSGNVALRLLNEAS